MRMVGFYLLFPLLPLLGLTDAGQEAIQSATFAEPSSPTHLSLAHATSRRPITIFLNELDLPGVSSSPLAAADWLRTHVLAHFPSNGLTTVVVGKGIVCHRNHEHHGSFVLPSVQNLYNSLVQWGLEKVIKVSVVFSSYCLYHPPFPSRFRDDLERNLLKPLLQFLQDSNLSYSIDPSLQSSPWVVPAHRAAVKRLGFTKLEGIRTLVEAKPRSRAPSSFAPPVPFATVPGSSFAFVPDASPSEIPFNSPLAHPQRPPLPPPIVPLIPVAAPPATEVLPPPAPTLPDITPVEPPRVPIEYPPLIPVLPEPPAIEAPTPPFPPFVPVFPPPTPSCSVAPAPGTIVEPKGGLWCVAKPAVPEEKLQEALDYACGEGEANCEAIGPNGNCYYPDTLVAHASYAFNSYWQKAKQSGGTCGFDGMAVLTDSDPSYLQCHYVLS